MSNMSNMNETPVASRVHIAIFGRRNAGKSSLINALTNQPVALVSDVPGTTTDPVQKTMELLPLGPVVIIDTAGLDDEGPLGAKRVKRTYEVLDRTDLAVLVLDGGTGLTDFERNLARTIRERNIPLIGVVNKTDLPDYNRQKAAAWGKELGLSFAEASTITGSGIEEIKMEITRKAPAGDRELPLVGDLINPGDLVVLVVPVDKAAPKGRLILPQQQVIRDLLDHDAIAVVTKDHKLRATLVHLGSPPALVITDSQVFAKVDEDTPRDTPMTSFSILMARQKGDLSKLVKGAQAIRRLRPGDRVLIAEACTHHRQTDDIGTVKIPHWLQQAVGGKLEFQWVSGPSLPMDLEQYQLVVHCGACMINRREMLARLSRAEARGVPVVNYGVLIAYTLGILPRALEPFPEAAALFSEKN